MNFKEKMTAIADAIRSKTGNTDLLTLDEMASEISNLNTEGTPGITPHIGANGNWYLGEEDTGVKAQGEDGAPGADGKNGADGQPGKDGQDGAPGKNGYTPQKGIDYWTEADQESIVQQVITALGTPVFGRVDADNNIILTGELVDGTYTIKYEDSEGNQTTIGTLTAEGEPTYTNVLPLAINADGTPYNGGQGWKTGYRINSSGVEVESSGTEVTGFIPITELDTIYFKNIEWNYTHANAGNYYVAFYDSTFGKIIAQSLKNSGGRQDGVSYNDGTPEAISIATYWDYYNQTTAPAYLRISCEEINNSSIITVNEPIE